MHTLRRHIFALSVGIYLRRASAYYYYCQLLFFCAWRRCSSCVERQLFFFCAWRQQSCARRQLVVVLSVSGILLLLSAVLRLASAILRLASAYCVFERQHTRVGSVNSATVQEKLASIELNRCQYTLSMSIHCHFYCDDAGCFFGVGCKCCALSKQTRN